MHSLCACAHKSIYCAHLQVCACWLVGSCVCDDTFRSGNRVFHSFTVHLSTFAICMHRILHDILHHTSNCWENDTPYISFCVRFGDVCSAWPCAEQEATATTHHILQKTIHHKSNHSKNKKPQVSFRVRFGGGCSAWSCAPYISFCIFHISFHEMHSVLLFFSGDLIYGVS